MLSCHFYAPQISKVQRDQKTFVANAAAVNPTFYTAQDVAKLETLDGVCRWDALVTSGADVIDALTTLAHW